MTRFLEKGETAAWQRLLSPLKYLLIKHSIKDRYDLWWPLGCTIFTMAVFLVLPVHAQILGDGGFLKGLRDFIGLLAAFYVVALAAVSTFSLETLDLPMEGKTPTLNNKDLSRRQFVCYLFGYLSVISFGIFLACISAEVVAPSLKFELSPAAFWWVRGVLGSVFSFSFFNMIITTMLGIFFLVERIHMLKDGAPTRPHGNIPKVVPKHDRNAA